MVSTRRFFAAAALIAAAVSLCSCEFLGLDMFPSDLKNLEASFDLRAYLASSDISFNGVERIERLESSTTGAVYLFVLLYTDSGSRLMILDEKLSKVEGSSTDAQLGRLLLADNSDQFLCGQVIFDANLNLVGHGSDTSAFYDGVCGYPDSSANYTIWSSSYSALSLASHDASWLAATPTTNDLLSTPSTTSYYQLVDLLSTDTASPFVLAFLVKNENNRPYIVQYADRAAFDAGFASSYATSNAVTLNLDVSPLDRSLWLTSDGIVALRTDSGPTRLVRYSFATGKELDSQSFNVSTENAFLSFEPEGRYYYRYDGLSGRLYKLRTWWK